MLSLVNLVAHNTKPKALTAQVPHLAAQDFAAVLMAVLTQSPDGNTNCELSVTPDAGVPQLLPGDSKQTLSTDLEIDSSEVNVSSEETLLDLMALMLESVQPLTATMQSATASADNKQAALPISAHAVSADLGGGSRAGAWPLNVERQAEQCWSVAEKPGESDPGMPEFEALHPKSGLQQSVSAVEPLTRSMAYADSAQGIENGSLTKNVARDNRGIKNTMQVQSSRGKQASNSMLLTADKVSSPHGKDLSAIDTAGSARTNAQTGTERSATAAELSQVRASDLTETGAVAVTGHSVNPVKHRASPFELQLDQYTLSIEDSEQTGTPHKWDQITGEQPAIVIRKQVFPKPDWRTEWQRQHLFQSSSAEEAKMEEQLTLVKQQELAAEETHRAKVASPLPHPLMPQPAKLPPDSDAVAEEAGVFGRGSRNEESQVIYRTVAGAEPITSPELNRGDDSDSVFSEVSESFVPVRDFATRSDNDTCNTLQVTSRREIKVADLSEVIKDAVLKEDPGRGQKQLDLLLQPRELGHLKVKLVWQDNQVRAEVMASTKQALQLLESHVQQLEANLAQRGITLAGMNLGLMQEQASPDWQQSARRKLVSTRRRNQNSAVTGVAGSQQSWRGGDQSGRLNLLL